VGTTRDRSRPGGGCEDKTLDSSVPGGHDFSKPTRAVGEPALPKEAAVTVDSVVSKDGTRIGFERRGRGPALVAVHGATADHTRWTPVADLLAERFTVHLVDRRGRGHSGDGPEAEYRIEREADDLIAVAQAAGAPVAVVGHSYGALVTLEACLRDGQFSRVLLYEPPFSTAGLPVIPPGVLDRMAEQIGRDDREAALTTFLREALNLDEAGIDRMRSLPVWRARIAAAHTYVRELRVASEYSLSPRLAELSLPVRFLVGTESPPYLRAATEAAHAAIPHSDVLEIAGQAHMAMDGVPATFADMVIEFCGPRA
jgi:pimeloyl-ACP methyl ester carboxylesterase